MSDQKIENVIIVGGGPAGYTAALYTSRANLEPLVIEGFQWGGQLQNTTDVENYPGYPDGIMGPEMMQQFRDQAERFGTRFITDDVSSLELTKDGGVHRVCSATRSTSRKTVILAMGAEPRRLGIPGELELAGRGVSTCGVCDGAFFKGEDVVVVGGGDSAMEDSIFISKFADDLKVVHRRDEFRASKIMLDRAAERENISFKTPFVPEEFVAGEDGKIAERPAAQRRDRRGGEPRGRRRLRRDRPRPALRARRGHHRHRRERLRPHPGRLDQDQPRGRLRRRRPRRSHLPSGRDRGRHRAAWARSTPSGTCATRRRRPRLTGRRAASRWRSRRSCRAPPSPCGADQAGPEPELRAGARGPSSPGHRAPHECGHLRVDAPLVPDGRVAGYAPTSSSLPMRRALRRAAGIATPRMERSGRVMGSDPGSLRR